MWLFGEQELVTEVGTMNLFMHWTNEAGVEELITAPLDDTILGQTRRAEARLPTQSGCNVPCRLPARSHAYSRPIYPHCIIWLLSCELHCCPSLLCTIHIAEHHRARQLACFPRPGETQA